MKTVYGWVAEWQDPRGLRLSVDLFFSSVEKFNEVSHGMKDQQLVKIQVPDEFNQLDFIPDNY